MLYQPYTIFFEIDNRLYIKFEALNWSTFLPNIGNFSCAYFKSWIP